MITKLESFYAQIPHHQWSGFPKHKRYGFVRARTWGYRLRLGGFIVEEGALDVPLPVVMFIERQGESMLGAEVVECLIDQIDSRFTFDQFELLVYWRWLPAMPARLFSAFSRNPPRPDTHVVMACNAMRFAA